MCQINRKIIDSLKEKNKYKIAAYISGSEKNNKNFFYKDFLYWINFEKIWENLVDTPGFEPGTPTMSR